jgi:K+/H+ antiporter YhaU regulatory subunit KhtT
MDPVVGVVELYGIGRRYDVPVDGSGGRLSVVEKRDGQRELYVFADAGEEPVAVVPMSEEQSRLLAAVLAGTYFVR